MQEIFGIPTTKLFKIVWHVVLRNEMPSDQGPGLWGTVTQSDRFYVVYLQQNLLSGKWQINLVTV